MNQLVDQLVVDLVVWVEQLVVELVVHERRGDIFEQEVELQNNLSGSRVSNNMSSGLNYKR